MVLQAGGTQLPGLAIIQNAPTSIPTKIICLTEVVLWKRLKILLTNFIYDIKKWCQCSVYFVTEF